MLVYLNAGLAAGMAAGMATGMATSVATASIDWFERLLSCFNSS